MSGRSVRKKARRPATSALFSPEKDAAQLAAVLEAITSGLPPEKIERLAEGDTFTDAYLKALKKAIPEHAAALLERLKADAPAMLADRRALRSAFEERHCRDWQEPLDLLEMFIEMSVETAMLFGEQWPWKQSPDKDLIYDMVRRLHARGCQVAREVLTLCVRRTIVNTDSGAS